MFRPVIVFVLALGYINAGKIRAHFPDEILDELRPISDTCLKETGLEPEILTRPMALENSDNEQFLKFMYCAFSRSGFIDERAKMHVNKVIELFPKGSEHEVRPILEKCDDIDVVEATEKVGKMYVCIFENLPVHPWF